MAADCSTVELLNRWQAGDQSAATQIFDRYGDDLRDFARRRMGPQLMCRVSPESVVQAALGSFLKGSSQGQFLLTETVSVWRLLTQITLNKVRRFGEFHQAEKRRTGREVQLNEADQLVQIAARGPTPDDSAMLVDLVGFALEQMPADKREIVILILDGHTHTEIARLLGISRATSHRAIRRFQTIVQQQLSRDESDE